jgi:pimeloyl-ACP methyl ester carboxylesterase
MALIHGFSGTGRHWEPVRARLESCFDVLVVNLAGHVGGPELPAGEDVSLGALIDAVERDMDAAGFQTAHVVGNSLGGWIALELAKRGRARSVVAISPAGGWEAGTRAERRLQKLFTRNHKSSARFMGRLDRWMRRPRLRRMLLWQVVAHGERIPAAVAVQLVRDSVECPVYFDLMDAIMRGGPPGSFDGIDIPVTLVWGTQDRILPLRTYSRRMRDMLPRAEWVELPGLGHVPMSDDPDLVTEAIISGARAAGAGGGAAEAPPTTDSGKSAHEAFTVA